MGGAGAGQPTAPEQPKLGEVLQITSLPQLQAIIKDYQGVIVDFWSTRCPPCMRFKPIFEGYARANKNKNIVFCGVETDKNRDTAMAFQVSSIPQFNFFFGGNQMVKFIGADEAKFRAAFDQLTTLAGSKASTHSQLHFKQFKPMNLMPMCYTSAGQIDKIKEFVMKFAQDS